MEEELSLANELGPWLKSDILCEFGDLLDDGGEELNAFGGKEAITLGTEDLLIDNRKSLANKAQSRPSLTPPEEETEWMKSLMNGQQQSQSQDWKSQEAQPFLGFPVAGSLGMPIAGRYGSSPLSCFRCPEEDTSLPNSWESNLSNYSLQDSLGAEFPSQPETRRTKLKSEDSFACSLETFYQEDEAKNEAPQAKKKNNSKSDTGVAKASLADRNRERQQRFRQRQKAKIETLENQVIKLTAQTQMLLSEKADLGSRATKLSELLQDKDRMMAMLSSQNSPPGTNLGGPECLSTPEMPQISLTYCSPPLVFTSSQLAKLDALDLTKIWKEYVWSLSKYMKTSQANPGQWTTEAERLDALTSELVHLIMHLWDNCPDFSSIMVSGFVEESHRRDESEDENWQRVAQQISLTNEQLVALSHLRNTMRMRTQNIWAGRREAQANLAACYEETPITSRDLQMQHQKVKQINEMLSSGIKEENLLARDFDFAFYKKVLRPDQRAICIVQAYPRFPDCQALANWVAACHGDSEARSMMTNHATSSSTSFHSS